MATAAPSSPQTWVLLNDVNKNSPKSYITKTVIITDIPQDNTTPILPTLDETYYFEYKSPVEAYNIVATDLNSLPNFKAYKLSVPEKGCNYVQFIAYETEPTCTKTYIYKVHNPTYENLRQFRTVIRSQYLHQYFVDSMTGQQTQ